MPGRLNLCRARTGAKPSERQAAANPSNTSISHSKKTRSEKRREKSMKKPHDLTTQHRMQMGCNGDGDGDECVFLFTNGWILLLRRRLLLLLLLLPHHEQSSPYLFSPSSLCSVVVVALTLASLLSLWREREGGREKKPPGARPGDGDGRSGSANHEAAAWAVRSGPDGCRGVVPGCDRWGCRAGSI